MSDLSRSAKSGNNWSSYDLDAYNIVIRNQSPRAFFGHNLPTTLENIDPEFLTAGVTTGAANDNTNRLLSYLPLASQAHANQVPAIRDFATELLRMLGFEEPSFVLRSRYTIPPQICGVLRRHTQADISLVNRCGPTICLIVQAARDPITGDDPEAQVIAKAIAAFQTNNRKRAHLGKEMKDSMSIPCITMVGTRPIFYVVPVTQELSKAVERGDYPEVVTKVRSCTVVGSGWLSDGMDIPDFRLEALKHYVLFRPLAKSLWSQFLV
ncbi:hypothetical protein PAXINDRAFT_73571 [Paxillus involutus ATCC 200175]|nr:hypothetical protein PAXINDRAFT_73571 [Paxillus involutus ATCC 200175]